VTPDVVVDIGNTRMKWGRVDGERIEAVAVLGLDDPAAWFAKAVEWTAVPFGRWTIASVNPKVTASLTDWLRGRSSFAEVVGSHRDVPIQLDVEQPESVGMDRLFACCAARNRLAAGAPFLVVQAGTALVVNFVSRAGVFAGGAILPGLSLMARSLHEHTALLPEVSLGNTPSNSPGRTTEEAIRTGVYWAAVGAIATLRYGFGVAAQHKDLTVFLTGGDAELLVPALGQIADHQPNLVLEGILSVYYPRPYDG